MSVETWKIYLRLSLASLKARMEYKTSFLFYVVAIVVYYAGQLGVLAVVLSRFKTINGWAIGEIAFLYGLLTFVGGFTFLFFHSLTNFDTMIVKGEFDRTLVRPLSPLGQVIFSQFEVSTIAHIVLGVAAMYYGTVLSGLEWTLYKALFFPLVVVGGVLIHASIRIFVSAVAFWTLRNSSLVHMVVFSSKEFIVYPVTIYNHGVQFFLTFIFPIAFVNFYPAHYFLERSGENLFHPALQLLTPVVGIVTFSISLVAWRVGINHYQSAGS
ncbi:MAG: ABC transporter permease [bacterium]|nr:MAG: ABC transporter permease [bacterium]